MTEDDLAGHTTAVEAPLTTTYRGYTIYETGLPTQGLIFLESSILRAGAIPKWDRRARAVHPGLAAAPRLRRSPRLGGRPGIRRHTAGDAAVEGVGSLPVRDNQSRYGRR